MRICVCACAGRTGRSGLRLGRVLVRIWGRVLLHVFVRIRAHIRAHIRARIGARTLRRMEGSVVSRVMGRCRSLRSVGRHLERLVCILLRFVGHNGLQQGVQIGIEVMRRVVLRGASSGRGLRLTCRRLGRRGGRLIFT